MAKSYTQVLQQIEILQVEADRLRRKEIDGVVARIREAIEHYGLTAADLGVGGSAAPAKAGKAVQVGKAPAKKGAKLAKVPKPVKYRDEAGRGWGGIGKRPQWLRDALAAGKSLQDFKVLNG